MLVEPLSAPVVAAIVAALLAVVGVAGIVLPVLPGSITIAAGLLVWAIWGGSSGGWIAFGVGLVFVLAGMLAGWVLTKRNLDGRGIPGWPVLVGVAAGVLGMFVLPALGLPIGFVLGLFLAELVRLREFREAVRTSWLAIRTLGLGMLIELGCAAVAGALLTVSIVTRFTFER